MAGDGESPGVSDHGGRSEVIYVPGKEVKALFFMPLVERVRS